MNRYTVITTATSINAGRLRLTPEQAKARLHNLKSLGDGVYQVLNAVQFKRGEQFDYDGELPKGMVSVAVEAGAKRANSPAEVKAAAKPARANSPADVKNGPDAEK